MAQIFAPGSVAGPAGPAGAAGSLANVKSLTDSVVTGFGNLFNYAAAQANYITNSDGTVGYHAPGTLGGGPPIATPLMYCPGATSMVCNSTLATGGFGPTGAWIQLFDANGNYLSNATDPGGSFYLAAGTAFTLPGTQAYVRLTIGEGLGTWQGANTMICAVVSGTATLPGSFQAFGLDTVADVNAKDAVVAANAATNLAAALTAIPAEFASVVLPGGPLGTRNAFNYKNVIAGYKTDSDGTLSVHGDHKVATIYCPNATQFITNLAFEANITFFVCTYDAYGNFIADITGTITTSDGNFYECGTVQALPGNQTYLKLSYAASNVNGASLSGYRRAYSEKSAVFYAGTTADPVPTSLTALNNSVPFQGNTASTNAMTSTALGATQDSADCTTIFNTFLATASSTNPIELVLDGIFHTTGLVLSPNGYTTIRGLGAGTGLLLPSGGVQDGIRVGAYVAGTGNSEGTLGATPPTRATQSIKLCDFQIWPNGQVFAAANQPVSGAAAHATYGIILNSCTDVQIDNVTFSSECAAYCVCLSNVDHVNVRNCNFTTGGTLHDGVHIDGPSEKIHISNCTFATGDDAIALNAYEGYCGAISDVTIDSCIFVSAATLLRAYGSSSSDSTNTAKVSRVAVSNCTGSVLSCVASLGLSAGGCNNANVDEIEDITFSNCDIIHTGSYAPFLLCCNVRSISIHNHTHHPSASASMVHAYGHAAGHILIDNLTVARGDEGSAAIGIVDANATGSGSLAKLTLRGIAVVDKAGSSYTAMPYVLSGATAIGELVIDSVDMDKFTALLDSNGTTNITTIKGAGVLGTGTSVPDSVMANNSLYLSSTASGALSMKVAGTAKRVTLT